MKTLVTLSLFCCLAPLMSLGFQTQEPVEALVVQANAEKSTLSLQFPDRAQPIEVFVSHGDAEIGYHGKSIQGNLITSQDQLRFERIWPVAPRWVDDTIRQVRQDTRSMKTQEVRMEGDAFPRFALCNALGAYISKDNFKGQWFFATVFFTRCGNPNMCPLVTKRMVELQQRLESEGIQDVKQWLLTFDPEYDTPGTLRQYASTYGANLQHTHFVAGDIGHTQDLMRQLGMLKRGGDDHTLCVLLVDPLGRIVFRQEGNGWDAGMLYDIFLKKKVAFEKRSS
jgi:protein SCO1/2